MNNRKILIYEASFKEKMVNVPFVCPDCNTDLTDEEAVEIQAYMETSNYGAVIKARTGPEFEYGDNYQDYYEDLKITGVICRNCRAILAGDSPL